MSVVAHQYNILAETLRRGIAGINAGKVAEASAGMEATKAKYGVEMGMEQLNLERQRTQATIDASKAQTEIARKQESRADKRFNLEKNKLEAEDRKAAIELTQLNTPAKKQTVLGTTGIFPKLLEGAGGDLAFEIAMKVNGLTLDSKGQLRNSQNRVISEWEYNNTPKYRDSMLWADPKAILVQTAGSIQQMIADPKATPQDQDELAKELKVVTDKIKWMDENPIAYMEKRTDALRDSIIRSGDPKLIPMYKEELGRMNAFVEASKGKAGDYERITYFSKEDPSDTMSWYVKKGDNVSLTKADEAARSLGYDQQKATSDSEKVRILSRVNKGLALAPGDQAIYDNMRGVMSPKDLTMLVIRDKMNTLMRMGQQTQLRPEDIKEIENVAIAAKGEDWAGTPLFETKEDLQGWISELSDKEVEYLKPWIGIQLKKFKSQNASK